MAFAHDVISLNTFENFQDVERKNQIPQLNSESLCRNGIPIILFFFCEEGMCSDGEWCIYIHTCVCSSAGENKSIKLHMEAFCFKGRTSRRSIQSHQERNGEGLDS